MTRISVLGSGAFGTALAISLASSEKNVTLWARSDAHYDAMTADRENTKRLPGKSFPKALTVTSDLSRACKSDILLLAIPMQKLREFSMTHAALLQGKNLVACCKGVDLKTDLGPLATLENNVPNTPIAVLSGPSFAVDIAEGLPTALTISARDDAVVADLQNQLATENIRLYSSTDPVGVELGGALKNVIAIACGLAIGAGLGESARAALITRGYAEMVRLATAIGGQGSTLSGLSGFGDLVLTCTSEKSRNYSHGLQLGRGQSVDPSITVEGVSTAKAVNHLAQLRGIDMPITHVVTQIIDQKISIREAVEMLLSRPQKKE